MALNFPSSPTIGQVYTSNGNTWSWTGIVWERSSITSNVVVNDISSQFDGYKQVFSLTQDQTAINSLTDSKDLLVVINGQRLTPYVTEIRYPWLTPYDSYNGFRVVGNTLIIYDAPDVGDTGFVQVVGSSTEKQTRKYPYSATTIALGD